MAKKRAFKVGLDKLKVCCTQTPDSPLWDEIKNGRKFFGEHNEIQVHDITKSALRIDAIVSMLDELGTYKRLAALTVYPPSANCDVTSEEFLYSRAFLRLYNEWLYRPEGIGFLMGAIADLHLEYNNITQIDIALTSLHLNFSRFILAAIRDTSIDMLYHGKVWNGCNAAAIPDLRVQQSISRKGKIRNTETIYCNMTKDNDVRMRSYNKDVELMANDDIKRSTLNQWLGLPADNKCALYRLEVELRNADLTERLISWYESKENVDYQYLCTGGILWEVMDEHFLLRLMYDSLNRLIRFRKGKTLLTLFDICHLDGVEQLN